MSSRVSRSWSFVATLLVVVGALLHFQGRAGAQDPLAVLPLLQKTRAALAQPAPEETPLPASAPDGIIPAKFQAPALLPDPTPTASPFIGWEDNNFILRSANGDFLLRITGQMQSDYRSFPDRDDQTDVDTFLIRRARLGIEADVFKYYEFRMLPDFDPNGSGTTKLQDGYINVHYWDAFQVEAGRFKEPCSYEQLVQDRFVPTVERSLIDQLVPARDAGLMIHGENLFDGRLSYAVGVFNGEVNGDLDTNDRKDVAARLAVTPFWTEEECIPLLQFLEIGVSGTIGIEQEPVSPTPLRTPATIPFFTFASTVREDGERWRVTPELSWFYGPIGFAAQYYKEKERLVPGGVGALANSTHIDLPFEGWYVMTTILLTGETRTTWSAPIEPLHPFDPADPRANPGAVAFVARASRLELGHDAANTAFPLAVNNATTTSSRGATELTLGFNWYLNAWVRVQFNYEHSWFDQPVRLGPGANGLFKSDDALLTRLQVIF